LLGNGGLGTQYLDQVMAHEIGHIFQALDEYTGGCSSCTAPSGYMSVVNGNCALCGHPEGKCIMRNAGTYDHDERENMETMIHPCRFTKGAAGFWDGNHNGIMDVLETHPETELVSTLPDTLDGSAGTRVVAIGWDEPAPTAVFPHPRSINRIGYAEVSIDGQPWQRGRATDGYFIDEIEEFEAVLPELGGGAHYVRLRGVNTSGVVDNSPPRVDFFVYDVKLRSEVEVFQEDARIAVTWQIDGEDFGSVYKLYRKEPGREQSEIASVPSLGRRNDRHRYFDSGIRPGADYVYRLEVEIPNKGRKLLGTATFSPVLVDAADGGFLAAAPNPSRSSFLLSIRVPVGPRPDRPDVIGLPDDFGNPPDDGIGPVIPVQRDGPSGGDDGGIEYTPQWRDLRMAVYDVTGRLVRDLGTSRAKETTHFNVFWDGNRSVGSPVRSGAYFVRVDVGYATETRKIVVIR
jgi:hypothetical protein